MIRPFLRPLIWATAAALTPGCSATPTTDATPEPDGPPETPALRVLVTGFNDWKDLGEPPNIWRCRDNPSCRLLIGDAMDTAPDGFVGPLTTRLKERHRDVEWTFTTLPVTWEIAKAHAQYNDHDVVVHVGLGVYDRQDTVFIEDGAFNRRRGHDAAGRTLDEAVVDSIHGDVLEAPSSTAKRVRALDGRTLAGYRVEVKAAREGNTYLCNETHFWALQQLEQDGRLKHAFFVHIPRAAGGDYDALADGVASVIAALIR